MGTIPDDDFEARAEALSERTSSCPTPSDSGSRAASPLQSTAPGSEVTLDCFDPPGSETSGQGTARLPFHSDVGVVNGTGPLQQNSTEAKIAGCPSIQDAKVYLNSVSNNQTKRATSSGYNIPSDESLRSNQGSKDQAILLRQTALEGSFSDETIESCCLLILQVDGADRDRKDAVERLKVFSRDDEGRDAIQVSGYIPNLVYMMIDPAISTEMIALVYNLAYFNHCNIEPSKALVEAGVLERLIMLVDNDVIDTKINALSAIRNLLVQRGSQSHCSAKDANYDVEVLKTSLVNMSGFVNTVYRCCEHPAVAVSEAGWNLVGTLCNVWDNAKKQWLFPGERGIDMVFAGLGKALCSAMSRAHKMRHDVAEVKVLVNGVFILVMLARHAQFWRGFWTDFSVHRGFELLKSLTNASNTYFGRVQTAFVSIHKSLHILAAMIKMDKQLVFDHARKQTQVRSEELKTKEAERAKTLQLELDEQQKRREKFEKDHALRAAVKGMTDTMLDETVDELAEEVALSLTNATTQRTKEVLTLHPAESDLHANKLHLVKESSLAKEKAQIAQKDYRTADAGLVDDCWLAKENRGFAELAEHVCFADDDRKADVQELRAHEINAQATKLAEEKASPDPESHLEIEAATASLAEELVEVVAEARDTEGAGPAQEHEPPTEGIDGLRVATELNALDVVVKRVAEIGDEKDSFVQELHLDLETQKAQIAGQKETLAAMVLRAEAELDAKKVRVRADQIRLEEEKEKAAEEKMKVAEEMRARQSWLEEEKAKVSEAALEEKTRLIEEVQRAKKIRLAEEEAAKETKLRLELEIRAAEQERRSGEARLATEEAKLAELKLNLADERANLLEKAKENECAILAEHARLLEEERQAKLAEMETEKAKFKEEIAKEKILVAEQAREAQEVAEAQIAADKASAHAQLEKEKSKAAEELRAEHARIEEVKAKAAEALLAEQSRLLEEAQRVKEMRMAEETAAKEIKLRIKEDKAKATEAFHAEQVRLEEKRATVAEAARAEQARIEVIKAKATEELRAEQSRFEEEKSKAADQLLAAKYAQEAHDAAEAKIAADKAKLLEDKSQLEAERLRHIDAIRSAEDARIVQEAKVAELTRVATKQAMLAEEARRGDEARISEEVRRARDELEREETRVKEEAEEAKRVARLAMKYALDEGDKVNADRRAFAEQIAEQIENIAREKSKIIEDKARADEEVRAQRIILEEDARRAEQSRLAEEKLLAEQIAEQIDSIAQEKCKGRAAEEAIRTEEARLAEVESRLAEEKARLAEEKARLAEEKTRLAEKARDDEKAVLAKQAEAAELIQATEAARTAAIEAKLAEESRLAEEARLLQDRRVAEEARLAQEANAAQEARAAKEAELDELAKVALEKVTQAKEDREEAQRIMDAAQAAARAEEEKANADRLAFAEQIAEHIQTIACEKSEIANDKLRALEEIRVKQARLDEQARLAKEAQLAEEQRAEDTKRSLELAALAAEEERQTEEARLAEEESRLAEEISQLAEEKTRLVEEKARLAEEKARLAEEKTRLAEKARDDEKAILAKQAEAAELMQATEAARTAAIEAKLAEESRLAEEARLLQDRRVAEEARLAQEVLKAKAAAAAEIAEEKSRHAKHIATEKSRAAECARDARIAIEAQIAADKTKLNEDKVKLEAEKTKHAEDTRIALEKAKLAEEARLAEEERLAEVIRRTKEVRLAEEEKLAEENRRAKEVLKLEQAQVKELLEEKERRVRETLQAEEVRIKEELEFEQARVNDMLELTRATKKAEIAELERVAQGRATVAEENLLAKEKRISEEIRVAREQLEREEARAAEDNRKAKEEIRIAREISVAKESKIDAARDELAKEQDVARAKLAKEQDAVKAELAKEKDAAKAELAKEQHTIRAELAKEQDAVRADLAKEQDVARTDLAKEHDAAMAELAKERDEIAQARSELESERVQVAADRGRLREEIKKRDELIVAQQTTRLVEEAQAAVTSKIAKLDEAESVVLTTLTQGMLADSQKKWDQLQRDAQDKCQAISTVLADLELQPKLTIVRTAEETLRAIRLAHLDQQTCDAAAEVKRWSKAEIAAKSTLEAVKIDYEKADAIFLKGLEMRMSGTTKMTIERRYKIVTDKLQAAEEALADATKRATVAIEKLSSIDRERRRCLLDPSIFDKQREEAECADYSDESETDQTFATTVIRQQIAPSTPTALVPSARQRSPAPARAAPARASLVLEHDSGLQIGDMGMATPSDSMAAGASGMYEANVGALNQPTYDLSVAEKTLHTMRVEYGSVPISELHDGESVQAATSNASRQSSRSVTLFAEAFLDALPQSKLPGWVALKRVLIDEFGSAEMIE